MKKTLTKTLTCFFLCWIYSSLSAQVYLDYANIHINITPTGGYNLSQIANGDYYVADNYPHYQADLDPDDDNKVQVYTSYLSSGLYLAKYDKNGKYLTHTFIRGGASASNAAAMASNDSFIAIMGVFYDSAWFYQVGGGVTLKNPKHNNYIAKYNHNLELIETLMLPNDSVQYDKIKFTKNGDLLIFGTNTGKVQIIIKDKSIEIEFNPLNRIPYTNDIFLLKLNRNLEYVKHTNFGIRGEESFNQIQLDKYGQVYLSGHATFRGKSYILGDTIPMSGNSRPLILKFNDNLELLKYHINNLLTIDEIILNPNGNILLLNTGKLSSQTSGYFFTLLDSNLNEKLRYNTNPFSTSSNSLSKAYGFISKTGDFGMAINSPKLNLKDSSIQFASQSLLVLSKDSLKLVSKHPINPYLGVVFHIDTLNILSTSKFSGSIAFQTMPNNGPPFTMGDPLYPTQQHTAVSNYRYDCTPVTSHLQYDTQVNCADQYSMYVGRGNVRLISQGSGASFQWYNTNKSSFMLTDHASPLQGGQYWKGTKTSFFKYGTGTNNYLFSQYIAKVGGSCTEPYWSDTATQIIWGAPQMLAAESSKNVSQGGTDSIEAYLQDKNYPIDSLEFQWYRGATALIDGLRFNGARTQKLYIKNIKDFDQGAFRCVATRIHCRDYSGVLGSSTFINVKITGLMDIKNSSISIYPNPTNGLLKIQCNLSQSIQRIEIYDAVGRLQKNISIDFDIINVEELETGLFTIKIITDTQVYASQFIKNK